VFLDLWLLASPVNSIYFLAKIWLKSLHFFSLTSNFTKVPFNKLFKSHSILFKYNFYSNFILTFFYFLFFLFSKSSHKLRKSKKNEYKNV
jgi:hypothetical protein